MGSRRGYRAGWTRAFFGLPCVLLCRERGGEGREEEGEEGGVREEEEGLQWTGEGR